MEIKYFDIRTKEEALMLLNYYNVLNLDSCEDFLRGFDYELISDFYEPDTPYIKVEFYENGEEIWHSSIKDDGVSLSEVSDFKNILREDKLKRILGLTYYCDNKRHLVCQPYSKTNLHKMADALNIKRCWFHKDHYDIPKRRIDEITEQCVVVSPKKIVNIINETR